MFFVCKQETEYGMRISDWSSDVCSSDLAIAAGHEPEFLKRLTRSRLARVFRGIHAGIGTADQLVFVVSVARKHCQTEAGANLDLDRIARLAQLQREWAGQGLLHQFDQGLSVGAALDVIEERGEFIAAAASH